LRGGHGGEGGDDRRRMLGTRTAATRDWNEYFTLGIYRRAQPPTKRH